MLLLWPRQLKLILEKTTYENNSILEKQLMKTILLTKTFGWTKHSTDLSLLIALTQIVKQPRNKDFAPSFIHDIRYTKKGVTICEPKEHLWNLNCLLLN